MGGSVSGNFGNTKGSRLDALSDFLTAASLIPGLDTFTDLAAIPVDLLRGDFLSAGLDAFGVFPFIGEIADTSKLAKMAGELSDIGKLSKKSDTIAKRSPIRIPKKATTQVQVKSKYSQIKFSWESGNYKYTSRWHTRTPNAPKSQGDSWVVERKRLGVGYGKNARPKKEEVLVGKNKWISKQDWQDAITSRKNGTATKIQKEWLNNGHWKDR